MIAFSYWADIDQSPFIHVVWCRGEVRKTWCGKPVTVSFVPETVNDVPKKRKCKTCNDPKNEPK